MSPPCARVPVEITYNRDLPGAAISQQQSPNSSFFMLLDLQHAESKVFPGAFLRVQGIHLRLHTMRRLLIFLPLPFLIMYRTTIQDLRMIHSFGISIPHITGGRCWGGAERRARTEWSECE